MNYSNITQLPENISSINDVSEYYDQNIKILKSKPVLYGKNNSSENFQIKDKFRLLHASPPRS